MKLASSGRGRHYSPLRGVVESALGVLYARDWPARLWARVPAAGRVRAVRHTLALLPPGAPPLRVGFASDLHVGPTTAPRTLAAAFELLAAARPDVLLLGGDYVFLDATARKCEALRALVASVPAPCKLAVLGNHDLWTDHGAIEAALASVGARVLTNDAALIAPGLAVLGLDDPWTGAPDLDRARAAAGDAARWIVLCHAAEALPLATADRRAALYLCGHTHGGHVATPWGPLVIPGRVGRRYVAGLHRVGDTWLHVSRGLGGIEVAPRAWAPPDVVVLDLLPDERGAGYGARVHGTGSGHGPLGGRG